MPMRIIMSTFTTSRTMRRMFMTWWIIMMPSTLSTTTANQKTQHALPLTMMSMIYLSLVMMAVRMRVMMMTWLSRKIYVFFTRFTYWSGMKNDSRQIHSDDHYQLSKQQNKELPSTAKRTWSWSIPTRFHTLIDHFKQENTKGIEKQWKRKMDKKMVQTRKQMQCVANSLFGKKRPYRFQPPHIGSI